MRLNIVAIRDRAADAFQQPFYVPALGQAIRAFQDGINKDEQMMKHPDDFDLYHLGYYDDQTGQFANLDGGPKQIAIGKQLRTS